MIEHDGKSGSLFKTTWLSKVDVGYRVAPPQTKEPLTPTYIIHIHKYNWCGP